MKKIATFQKFIALMHSNSIIEVSICNPSAFLYGSKIRLSFASKKKQGNF